MPDDELLRRYEAEHQRHQHARLDWMPAPLEGRAVLALGRGRAFWADAFRGYPDGITFTTHYRWIRGHLPEADPDAWPNLAIQFAASDPVNITADVDGRGEPRSTGTQGGHALHAVGSAAVPGIATAEWWLPEVPLISLALAFFHASLGLEGAALVDTHDWTDEIATNAIRVG
jgi:hypothetical protein